jgi:S-(hydroxymethyl)glutathione dehydrogenase/alcohol dehydrogenase
MKSQAAVLTEVGKPWEVMEVDVKDPGENEVLIRYLASGLCHSDLHVMTGDIPVEVPYVGGHEGAGIIEAVGPGVTKVVPGDHIVCSFVPACGRCRWCATGRSSLCDYGEFITKGCLPNGTWAFSVDGRDAGAMCMLGTFSQYGTVSEASVVKVDDDLPLEVAVLVGCGVPTGWGSAVNAGNVQIGDTVLIYGIGGVGANAVQGAAHAGATTIIAVDPLASKREFAQELGATHSAETPEEAAELARHNRAGGADVAIITAGIVDEETVTAANAAIRKNGTIVLTGLAHPAAMTVHLSGFDIALSRKRIIGSLFGDCNPASDIVRLLDLYRAGKLKLDELVTQTYSLNEINQGYDDLEQGKNIRGVIIHEQ